MYDHGTSHIPIPPETTGYLVGGKQHVKARGQVNVSLKHPQYYVEIVRRWFNDLRWQPRVQGPNKPQGTDTLLECVVDFESTTGHSLATVKAEDSWAEKAKRPAYYLKVQARTHRIKWNGAAVACKKALRPTTGALAITPLVGPLMSGFEKEPNFGG